MPTSLASPLVEKVYQTVRLDDRNVRLTGHKSVNDALAITFAIQISNQSGDHTGRFGNDLQVGTFLNRLFPGRQETVRLPNRNRRHLVPVPNVDDALGVGWMGETPAIHHLNRRQFPIPVRRS